MILVGSARTLDLLGISQSDAEAIIERAQRRRDDAGARAQDWFPTEMQERVLRTRCREMLFGGARGGGKSEVGEQIVAVPAIRGRFPRYRGLVLRETAGDLADWVDRAREKYRSSGVKVAGKPAVFTWPWGSKIYCGHLHDERSIGKYLGREFQRIVVEELTQIKDPMLYLKLLGSARSTVPGLTARLFATTNPGGPGHYWVKERFIDPAPPGTFYRDPVTGLHRIFIKSVVRDNPFLLLGDPAYVAYLMGLPEKLRRAWLDGDWDVLEGQYFTEWREAVHVVRPHDYPVMDTWQRYRVIDWGYWPDPCVCLWIASPPIGPDVIYREKQWHRTLPKDVARDILRLSHHEEQAVRRSIGDPSMWKHEHGPSVYEGFLEGGLHLTQADNSRVPGWLKVHEYLAPGPDGKPGLVVYDTCRDTIKAIPAMVHDERNPSDVAEHPLDHWADCVRYYCMSRRRRGALTPTAPTELSLADIRKRLKVMSRA